MNPRPKHPTRTPPTHKEAQVLIPIPAFAEQVAIIGLIGCAIGGVACGGNSSSSSPTTTPTAVAAPPPSPTPPPAPTPITNVLFSGSDGIGARFILYYTFSTTATGTIGASVDWTFATSDLDVFLARGTHPCSLEQFNNRQCTFLGSATSTTSKPEQLSVPNLTAGPYTLYIGNFSNTQESLSYQISLTSLPGTSALKAATPETTPGIKRALSGLAMLR